MLYDPTLAAGYVKRVVVQSACYFTLANVNENTYLKCLSITK